MSCQFPFQSIRCLEVDGERSNRFLVAAAGPELHVYDVKTGGRRSVWTAAAAVNVNVSANANANADAAQAQKKKEEEHDGTGVSAPAIGEALENEHGHEHDGPPEKRRKLSVPAQEAEAGTTTTAATEVDDGKGAKTNNSGGGGVSAAAPSLSVSLLAVSRTKGLVVVVTGEDKCVRTLQINSDGGLSQMSERHMPKRPSAIILADNDNAIIVADKFGDVYSLPVLYDKNIDTLEASKADIAPPSKKSKPAANYLTVHTKKNLQVLEQQAREIESRAAASEQAVRNAFPYTLLLGHVSLLTDLALVTLPPSPPSSNNSADDHATTSSPASSRSYLITADRDEHIRISRAPPQPHVIEGYCLGHRSFVNKICIPPWDRKTMVSGGGDDFLLVWDWQHACAIRQRIPIPPISLEKITPAADHPSQSNAEAAPPAPPAAITVSAIWDVGLTAHPDAAQHHIAGAILVAVEGSPTILIYTTTPEHTLAAQPHALHLPGNALSMAELEPGTGKIVVSIDTFFAPGSTKTPRTPAAPEQKTEQQTEKETGKTGSLPVLQTFVPVVSADGTLRFEAVEDCQMARAINGSATTATLVSSSPPTGDENINKITEILYPACNLRKSEKCM